MPSVVAQAFREIVEARNLDAAQAEAVLMEVMEGNVTAPVLAGLLVAWRLKGETTEELVGAARALRSRARTIRPRRSVVDTCGTGGDGRNTFNISTAAALIAASAGAAVAKHGNRAVSGRVGGADVLEALGVPIDVAPEKVAECLDTTGFGFMFAPRFHPAMANVAAVRRELGVRTIFNLLGPLANPAGARRQLTGVFAPRWLEPMARALGQLGAECAWVVHSEDGLDEISLSAPTRVCTWEAGNLRSWVLRPEEFGFELYPPEAFVCTDLSDAVARMRSVLHGVPGPCTEVAILNAAAALCVAGQATSLKEGVELARDVVARGAAWEKLQEVVEGMKE